MPHSFSPLCDVGLRRGMRNPAVLGPWDHSWRGPSSELSLSPTQQSERLKESFSEAQSQLHRNMPISKQRHCEAWSRCLRQFIK
uniref:Uncharacterized protein n=1 Tax=Physcomitrium patens TaxID=3218 RepID=A0A2K1ICK2_PHYPA|nr:hypothetical protein PHYPA_030467 [Physcomitrium patens]